MSRTERPLLFDDDTGHLTGFALQSLVDGSLEEPERLEAAEHLSYCDLCVERYTAMLTEDTLLEAPELLKPGIFKELRRRMTRVFVNCYFHMGVAACLTLVLWSTGVFASFGELALNPPRLERPEPVPARNEITLGQRVEEFTAGFGDGFYDFMDQLNTFDLRGALTP